MDSGFFSGSVFDCLEEEDRKTDCITAVPMYVSVQRKIRGQRTRLKIENGIEVTGFEYQGQEWSKSRRMVAVRQKRAIRPRAVGKQLSLFEEDMEISGYCYTCYVTSLQLSAADVWRLYRQRANCENCLKELKYDYGLDKMNQASFDVTESSLLDLLRN